MSSEKTAANQLGLFNETEEVDTTEIGSSESESITVKSHTRASKPRVTIPDNLPREEIVHGLPDAEEVCPHDGSALKHIGSDDHEQLEIIPAKSRSCGTSA